MAPGRFQATPPRVHAGAWLTNGNTCGASMRPGAKRRDQPFGQQYLAPDCGLASMRPDAKRRDHRRRSPGWRIRLRCLNEARRETPGSRERRGFSVRGSVDASMRPGANAGINASGNSAPDYGLASMRPDANRRDHACRSATDARHGISFNEARREAPGSRGCRPDRRRSCPAGFNEARRESPGSRR